MAWSISDCTSMAVAARVAALAVLLPCPVASSLARERRSPNWSSVVSSAACRACTEVTLRRYCSTARNAVSVARIWAPATGSSESLLLRRPVET